MDWFTSDLHMDHLNILKHRPGFETQEEINDVIFKMFDPVRKGDRVFLLGDIGWNKANIDKLLDLLLNKKKALVFWIKGNHDDRAFEYIRNFEHKNFHRCETYYIKGYGKYKPIFMSHYPHILWNKSYYGSYMLHGHGHINTADRPMLDNMVFGKRLNVNLELHDYKLWSRDEVEEYMKSRPNNIDEYLVNGTEDQKKIIVDYMKAIKFMMTDMYEKLGEI